jgi:hypothetical protein
MEEAARSLVTSSSLITKQNKKIQKKEKRRERRRTRAKEKWDLFVAAGRRPGVAPQMPAGMRNLFRQQRRTTAEGGSQCVRESKILRFVGRSTLCTVTLVTKRSTQSNPVLCFLPVRIWISRNPD